MNRILLSLIAIVASGSASSLAQQIEPLKSQTRVYFNGYQSGSSFGQLGVSFARKCQLQSRSDVYLVGNELYATDRADCIAIVLNTSHPEASDAGPNWVNIQVTRYFESYDNAAVTIGRSGTFKRDGRVLPLLPSDGVDVPRAGLEAFAGRK